nr:hypothetical protein [Tanacetum cinerariifolium]
MDLYTKNALWAYWMRGDNEVSNEEVSDLNNDDEHEIAKIFQIETNLFDYETPLCTGIKEFNYLLKLNTDLFTHDVEITNTYRDYDSKLNNKVGESWSKDGVPYDICDHICETFHFKNGKVKWPTCSLNEDDICNGGELPRMVRVGYMTYFQDYECNAHKEEEQEDEERCELFDDPTHESLIFKIRRFEMITYSFGQKEEYIAIKEYEYDDFSRTNEDACHAYQEIFYNMDEGLLRTRAK